MVNPNIHLDTTPYPLSCAMIQFAISTVVQQQYDTEVNNEYVIRGNSAILKCSIPSFVADFVTVVSWHESGNSFILGETKDGDGTTRIDNSLYLLIFLSYPVSYGILRKI